MHFPVVGLQPQLAGADELPARLRDGAAPEPWPLLVVDAQLALLVDDAQLALPADGALLQLALPADGAPLQLAMPANGTPLQLLVDSALQLLHQRRYH